MSEYQMLCKFFCVPFQILAIFEGFSKLEKCLIVVQGNLISQWLNILAKEI